MATYAAGNAASSPRATGSTDVPISAPTSVDAFQKTYTATPVIQKAARCAVGSCWAVDIAVDSSMVSCAATRRVVQRPGMRRPIVSA